MARDYIESRPRGQGFKAPAECKGCDVNPHPLFALTLQRRLDERYWQPGCLPGAAVSLKCRCLLLCSLLAGGRETSLGCGVGSQLLPGIAPLLNCILILRA